MKRVFVYPRNATSRHEAPNRRPEVLRWEGAAPEGARVAERNRPVYRLSCVSSGNRVIIVGLASAPTYDVPGSDLPASTSITFSKGGNIGTVTQIATGDTDLTFTIRRTL